MEQLIFQSLKNRVIRYVKYNWITILTSGRENIKNDIHTKIQK